MTFVRAWSALGRYHEQSRFVAWLFSILTNECRAIANRERRHGKHVVTDDAALSRAVAPEAHDGDTSERLTHALGTLRTAASRGISAASCRGTELRRDDDDHRCRRIRAQDARQESVRCAPDFAGGTMTMHSSDSRISTRRCPRRLRSRCRAAARARATVSRCEVRRIMDAVHGAGTGRGRVFLGSALTVGALAASLLYRCAVPVAPAPARTCLRRDLRQHGDRWFGSSFARRLAKQLALVGDFNSVGLACDADDA